MSTSPPSSTDISDIVKTLRKVPLFKGLDGNQLTRLSSVVTGKEFPRASVIVTEGDPGATLFFLKKGAAKVTRVGEDGREVILAFLGVR